MRKLPTFNNSVLHPLQTSQWGKFRNETGNEVKYTKFGLIIFHKIPLTGLKIGTLIKGSKPTTRMLKFLRNLAIKERAIFIKLEPNVVTEIKIKGTEISNYFQKSEFKIYNQGSLDNLMRKNGCIPGKTLFTPTTFWIDLTQTEEELMKGFHPKTRYNIRLAQKKGVKISVDNSDKAFEKYLALTKETVERQGFYAHTKKYHRLMWKNLYKIPVSKSQTPIARLLVAKYKKEIITAWIIFVWRDFLYYPYGASSSNPSCKPLMTNNLMMWETIRYGKGLGLKIFDLWGREEGKGVYEI
jgi:lipid II:glycine glycyltransferase (peptidoglycan interpeptide bridge formation enzyme)